jgi:cofilin
VSISGIGVSEDVVKKYEDKRYDKKPGGWSLMVKDEEIVIDNEYGPDFDKLVTELPQDEPRYVLYDVPVKNRANLDDVRTAFVFWMPMSSPVRLRMRYASSKSIITQRFRGIATQIQVEEKENLNMDYIVNKIYKSQGINNP